MNTMSKEPEFMSIYIADYLIPTHFQMRKKGLLKKGKKQIEIQKTPVQYEGELD